jgi:hypothetical protein
MTAPCCCPSVDALVEAVQLVYETISIQRAFLVCADDAEADALHAALRARDFPAQLCKDGQCTLDPYQRLYLVSYPSLVSVRDILLTHDVNLVMVTDGATFGALLGPMYTYAQACCHKPLFFLPLGAGGAGAGAGGAAP